MDAAYLTIKDVCDLLQISLLTVSRCIKTQKLQSKKTRRLVRVASQDLAAFIEGQPHRKLKPRIR